mmetsp:Transcript_9809/g.28070  ORF Transcript_9809/g.28070 Transcript_9809/m.28070 type:complete len:349 (-) Transcript_9809:2106-3152(-)
MSGAYLGGEPVDGLMQAGDAAVPADGPGKRGRGWGRGGGGGGSSSCGFRGLQRVAHIKVEVPGEVDGHPPPQVAVHKLAEVGALAALVKPVQQPQWLMGDQHHVVTGRQAGRCDVGKVAVLEDVYVVDETQIQTKQPPALRQVEREIAFLLRQHPAPEPALAGDVPHKGLQAIDPVMVPGDGKALRPLVVPQGMAAPAVARLLALPARLVDVSVTVGVPGIESRVWPILAVTGGAPTHAEGRVVGGEVWLVDHHPAGVVMPGRRQGVLKGPEEAVLVGVVAWVGVGEVTTDDCQLAAWESEVLLRGLLTLCLQAVLCACQARTAGGGSCCRGCAPIVGAASVDVSPDT